MFTRQTKEWDRRPIPARIAGLSLIAASALIGGCGSAGEELTCTAEARSSVTLSVVDRFNVPLAGVDVTYQVDGGPVRSPVAGPPCEPAVQCALAYEVSGVFFITASKPGYAPASATATVGRDACHVITQLLTLTLQPAN